MMSSGWGSLDAKGVAGGDGTGKPTGTSTAKNEVFSTKASGLGSLESMSLSEQEEKVPEKICTDTDDGTAVDNGKHCIQIYNKLISYAVLFQG